MTEPIVASTSAHPALAHEGNRCRAYCCGDPLDLSALCDARDTSRRHVFAVVEDEVVSRSADHRFRASHRLVWIEGLPVDPHLDGPSTGEGLEGVDPKRHPGLFRSRAGEVHDRAVTAIDGVIAVEASVHDAMIAAHVPFLLYVPLRRPGI
jgi:hypothetical protein